MGRLEMRLDKMKDDVEQLTRTVAAQNEIVAEHRGQWVTFLKGLHPKPDPLDPDQILADALST